MLSSSSPRSSSSSSSLRLRHHELAGLLIVCAIASVILFALAAHAYSGGTHFDHSSSGHDFWRNTICDVARMTALDGRSNAVSATLARTAMTILAIGVGVLFWLVPLLFSPTLKHKELLSQSIRILGVASVPGAIAVAFVSTDIDGFLHGIAIICAGVPGLVAAVLSVIGLGLVSREDRTFRITPVISIGIAALATAVIDFLLYVEELVVGGSASLAISALERIAAVLVVAWMFAVAKALRARMGEEWVSEVARNPSK